MSLSLEFEPHSWYMDFAIQKDQRTDDTGTLRTHYNAYTENGDTYRVDELFSGTLTDLKESIRNYHLRHRNGYAERIAKRRLEYLRGEIEHARISYGEIVELQDLVPYIDKDDNQLLEWTNMAESE